MEDYKKKYEEAIVRGSQLWESDTITRESYEYIFPELKESEDEKIRKAILELVKQSSHILNPMNQKSMIAWLKKQGEKKPTDKVEPKFKVGDVIKNINNGDTVKIEQILDNYYCYSGWDGAATIHSDFKISEEDNWKLVKQKSAWSEEDKKKIELLIAILEVNHPNGQFKVNPINTLNMEAMSTKELVDWLKSLKERMKGE